jgi:hypothetical protein
MLAGIHLEGCNVLEPSAGKGDIVRALQSAGANVNACEIDTQLQKLIPCKIIADDFLTVTSDQISHVQYIVMNPPFDADEKHILHAYNIAPAGCDIIALCNLSTVKNTYTQQRQELRSIIDMYGSFEDIGKAFAESERHTFVEVALIRIKKQGESREEEFSGFLMDEEPQETGSYGIMSYNAVRDLVNRYIQAVKIYDKQLDTAIELQNITSGFFHCKAGMTIKSDKKELTRNEFKKEMQKAGWEFIFQKMDLERTATQSLREDLNKFIETQVKIPFTMHNIYNMLQIIVGTTEQRMDKAILSVFDKVTSHADENRMNLEGWKTNSMYLLNRKFIIPRMCEIDRYHSGAHLCNTYGNNWNFMEDMVKAICYLTGDSWEKYGSLSNHCRYEHRLYTANNVEYFSNDIHYNGMHSRSAELQKQGVPHTTETGRPVYGEPFNWAFFKVRAYKKGTMHFEFIDEEIWAKFNQRVSKLKGYPLPEKTKQKQERKGQTANHQTAEILFSI